MAALLVALVVGVGQPLADLQPHVGDLLRRQRLPLLARLVDDVLEVHPVDKLHDDEVGPVGEPQVEDLHAVGVVEVEADLGLVQEHAHEALVLGEVGQDALDRDELLEALQATGVGLEDLGHASRVDAFKDVVALLGHGTPDPDASMAAKNWRRSGGASAAIV